MKQAAALKQDERKGLDAPEEKTRRKSHVVPIMPKAVLALKKTEQKPKQLLKQYSQISVFDGKNYAVDKKEDAAMRLTQQSKQRLQSWE